MRPQRSRWIGVCVGALLGTVPGHVVGLAQSGFMRFSMEGARTDSTPFEAFLTSVCGATGFTRAEVGGTTGAILGAFAGGLLGLLIQNLRSGGSTLPTRARPVDRPVPGAASRETPAEVPPPVRLRTLWTEPVATPARIHLARRVTVLLGVGCLALVLVPGLVPGLFIQMIQCLGAVAFGGPLLAALWIAFGPESLRVRLGLATGWMALTLAAFFLIMLIAGREGTPAVGMFLVVQVLLQLPLLAALAVRYGLRLRPGGEVAPLRAFGIREVLILAGAASALVFTTRLLLPRPALGEFAQWSLATLLMVPVVVASLLPKDGMAAAIVLSPGENSCDPTSVAGKRAGSRRCTTVRWVPEWNSGSGRTGLSPQPAACAWARPRPSPPRWRPA